MLATYFCTRALDSLLANVAVAVVVSAAAAAAAAAALQPEQLHKLRVLQHAEFL